MGISTTDDDGAAPYSKPAQKRADAPYSDNSRAGRVDARDIHKLGVEVFGSDGWNNERSDYAEAASGSATKIINDLKPSEMEWLLDELNKEKRGSTARKGQT